MLGLADKVALVTGGSSGIGEACVHRLACAKAAASWSAAATRPSAAPWRRAPAPASASRTVTGDVRRVADCERIVEETVARLRPPRHPRQLRRHLAGEAHPEMSEADWDDCLDTCLKGAFFVSQAALAHMVRARQRRDRAHRQRLRPPRRAGGGRLRGRQGRPHQLVRSLARDHGPDGIRVVAVSPGIIDTPMLDKAIADSPDPEAYAGGRPTATRWGASAGPRRSPPWSPSWPRDEAAFVSGVSWLVDGGYCA